MKSYEVHETIRELMTSAPLEEFSPDISDSERKLLELDTQYVDAIARNAMHQGYLRALTNTSRALLAREFA